MNALSQTRIRVLVAKEWAEVFKNRLVLFGLGLVPFVVTLTALGVLAGTRYLPQKQEALPEELRKTCEQLALAEADCMQGALANQFMALFLLWPLIVPLSIATFSIVGEKITRTLEPLLATPVSTAELVLGKSLAAALPAVAVTWLSFGIFQAAAVFVATPPVHALILAPKWWVAMALVAPVLSVLSVNVAIMISSRVNDPRVAQQLGMLVMLPLLAVFVMQVAGVIALNLSSVLAGAAVLAALDVVLTKVAVRLFQRETILTRWR